MYLRSDFSTHPLPCKDMYAFRVTVSTIEFFQKNLKYNRTCVFNNMMQMLQVNKNSNIKYNTSKIKLRRHTKLN